MIARSLNASAMYLGFAIGGALGGAVLATSSPTDLGLDRRIERCGRASGASRPWLAGAAKTRQNCRLMGVFGVSPPGNLV